MSHQVDQLIKCQKHTNTVKNIVIKRDDSMFNGLNELNYYLSMNRVNSH